MDGGSHDEESLKVVQAIPGDDRIETIYTVF